MNPTPPERPNQPNALAEIFLNDEGLRPIWSLILFLAIRALLRLILFPIALFLFPALPPANHLISARTEYIFESATLLSILAATWLMSKLESRPISAYGFNSHRILRNFLTGLTTGASLLSLLIFSLHRLHLLTFDARLLSGTRILHFALVWALGFLLVALAEESFLRAYLQFTLTRALIPIFHRLTPPRAQASAFWTSALLLSLTFGALHRNNPGESPIGLIAATLVALIFCLSLWRTGSLWWAIGFHTAWDWAQSFLYGVPDSGLLIQGHLFATHPSGRTILSGGLTGPEGSALIFPILLLACATVLLTSPPRRVSF
ncbi:MAG TPA: type II CAAX endopeptidase family protein [Acidobacteriaceae bacterium]|nr:type II CAAX endopeptidase family protein [Acidobacteriaceae bacterium]